MDPAIAYIRSTKGLAVKVAKALGIGRQAVYQWRRVPPERVLTVSEVTGLPPHQIRPDLYPVPARAAS
ncbi:Cro/CI family transcriptional regulator [Rhodoplanes sp. TEM]|uniref:Cro/CI family transcriptional regulator n=1 Tax=Rhodoplanes tepidamans TaxID=200616 RepID=A0ABT5J5A4_RHOTP|nr:MULTISPECIES: Cro/CI family transcriptional regulator [Rhodoplanes]MDC7784810.1 Cro/CI family transcriptional regulator [Rhodoplanes tepidamans]MDC7982277.1 Cro/CI family transcriptional regulator [Rhodoplanes sp. TEM]MDQ0356284.1 DNA-binding transcriptional regulator YdaS (Cro superfamily) [Rhodoplanes tepidamans]